MKLSVIIPAFNATQFIRSSYESIMNQGISDYEIIYVDNNSSDATLDEIKKIQKLNSRVSYYQQSVPGSAPTRNKGIEHAKGDYLYFFDVDDAIFPEALQRMIQVLDTYPDVEAVFGKMVKSRKRLKEIKKPTDETYDVILKPKPYWGLQWFSDLSSVVGPPAFLYRRTVFDKIGIYNVDLRIGQDTALDIKLGMTCDIAFLDMYVYMYFKHTSSTIEKSKRKQARAFMQWPRLVKEHLPFYIENAVPLEFKKMLFEQIYEVMGKQVYLTKGLVNRKTLKKNLLNDIQAIHVPSILRIWLSVLVLIPISYTMKFYVYYLVPYIVKKIR